MTKNVISLGNGMYLRTYNAVEEVIKNLLSTVNTCKDEKGFVYTIDLRLLMKEKNDMSFKMENGRFTVFGPVMDSYDYHNNYYREDCEYAHTDDVTDVMKIQTCMNLLELYKPLRYE